MTGRSLPLEKAKVKSAVVPSRNTRLGVLKEGMKQFLSATMILGIALTDGFLYS